MKIRTIDQEFLRLSSGKIPNESLRNRKVYFETDADFGQFLSCNPHAFLVGCIMPAMHHGEKRIFIDAEVCPKLRDGLITAMAWFRNWYYKDDHYPLQIDTKTQTNSNTPAVGGAALSFS